MVTDVVAVSQNNGVYAVYAVAPVANEFMMFGIDAIDGYPILNFEPEQSINIRIIYDPNGEAWN